MRSGKRYSTPDFVLMIVVVVMVVIVSVKSGQGEIVVVVGKGVNWEGRQAEGRRNGLRTCLNSLSNPGRVSPVGLSVTIKMNLPCHHQPSFTLPVHALSV